MRPARSPLVLLGALAAVSAVTVSAHALQQPDSTVIPVIDWGVTSCSDKNVQVCLNAEEGGQTIDALAAAATTPETYKPICGLTFKVLARGAGYMNTFGWYNVTGAKPPDSDLHSFLECSDGPGATKVLNIKNDPGYQGGEIGFFMATPEGASGNCPQFNPGGGPVGGTVGYVYYSQKQFNPDGAAWVHLITYNSVTHANSFYFAWEDLLAGGDNDFDDLLTRVEGIQCSGGGDPCTVPGQQGKCANGTMQCQNGQLACVQTQQPSAESCNALDDDCNGLPDDGDLCPVNEVCWQGKCVPKCGTGEFDCKAGTECNGAGICIEIACKNVSCDAGKICVGGVCKGACDGVVCPYGQSCVEGACIDPCAAITCDPDFVCVLGVCKLKCSCDGCEAGKTCDTTTEKCEDPGCAPNPCGAGTHCAAGQCVDDCQGATCPTGQACVAGQCVVDTDGGTAGSGGGTTWDGGFGATGAGGSGGGAASGTGGSGNTGAIPSKGDSSGSGDEGGCGCRTPGAPERGGLALLGLLLALGAARRKRRG